MNKILRHLLAKFRQTRLGGTRLGGRVDWLSLYIRGLPRSDAFAVCPNSYFTYPHCNAFLSSGTEFVYVQLRGGLRLRLHNLKTHEDRELCRMPGNHLLQGGVWPEVDESSDTLYFSHRQNIWSLDLKKRSSLQRLFTTSDTMDDLVGAHQGKVYFSTRKNGHTTLHCLEKTHHQVLGILPFYANHVQVSPFDGQLWFSHEGSLKTVRDRIWSRHQDSTLHALPTGIASSRGIFHERLCFHQPGGVVVGSAEEGVSSVFAYTPQSITSLLSQGTHDSHVNISRDGRLLVLDTAAEFPFSRSSLILVGDSGARKLLGHTFYQRHPFHPHPHFSPDGKFLIYTNFLSNHRWRLPSVEILSLEGFGP